MSKSVKNPAPDLDALRGQIDNIDDTIHDLLMQRAELANAIRSAKSAIEGDGKGEILSAYRPAREADMLRRLKSRHKGRLPFAAVARIWREIIASLTQMQAPYGLYICGGSNLLAFHDIGRFYYGAAAHIHVHEDADAVLDAVSGDPAGLGLLPYPSRDETTPWWPRLVKLRQNGIAVIASLPFFDSVAANTAPQPSILVISHAPFEPSGDDTTLLVINTPAATSKTRAVDMMRQAGIDCHILAQNKSPDRPGTIDMLAAATGFLDKQIKSPPEINKTTILGGYANPITTGEQA